MVSSTLVDLTECAAAIVKHVFRRLGTTIYSCEAAIMLLCTKNDCVK